MQPTTTAKYFMIDDICCYIGSQNLYKCDLAEWGVVIDDAARVQAIKEEFWYVASLEHFIRAFSGMD
jgi:hypothetical protein